MRHTENLLAAMCIFHVIAGSLGRALSRQTVIHEKSRLMSRSANSQIVDPISANRPTAMATPLLFLIAHSGLPESFAKGFKMMKTELIQKTNGIDTVRLKETIQAIRSLPELARFNFQLVNRWTDGAANESETRSFYGCNQALSHKTGFTLAADEPDILLGNDRAANPVEHLLHALASCVTTSMIYHAAARGILVEQVESSIDADVDLRGFLGLDPSVRNGCEQIRLKLRIRANVTDEQLRELGELGPTFSPVFDSLMRGVPIVVATERIL